MLVHALEPRAQFREIAQRLQLERNVRPFTLCLHCNLVLAEIDAAQVRDRVPPTIAATYDRFRICPGCRRVYWEGSHWARMRAMLGSLLAGTPMP